MTVVPKPDQKQWFSDKSAILRILEESDARTGFVFDPTAAPKEVRELMRAQGIRPEENFLSRDIIRARYEDEELRRSINTI